MAGPLMSHQSKQSSSRKPPSVRTRSKRSDGMGHFLWVASGCGTITPIGGNGSEAIGWTTRRTAKRFSCPIGTSAIDERWFSTHEWRAPFSGMLISSELKVEGQLSTWPQVFLSRRPGVSSHRL